LFSGIIARAACLFVSPSPRLQGCLLACDICRGIAAPKGLALYGSLT